MTPGPLSDRTRRVLACLVKDYIDTGEPVASAALCRRAGLGVSSATMASGATPLGIPFTTSTGESAPPFQTKSRCFPPPSAGPATIRYRSPTRARSRMPSPRRSGRSGAPNRAGH